MAELAERPGIRVPDLTGTVGRAFNWIGRATLLAVAVLKELPRPRMYWQSSLNQAYQMGIRSLPLVLLMAFLGGTVTSQQTGAQFTGGLPLWVVGSVVAASVITELGPVLTGMVLVGRIGASIAAELGTMKVTEQIDALYSIGRDPVSFLVVPRIVGALLAVPALVVLANVTGVLSGWALGVLLIDGLTSSDFVYGMRFYFRPWVMFFSVIKGTAFGLSITFLACFIGLQGRGGAEGVGRTTTATVVATTVSIMVMDVMLVPLLKAF